MNNTNENINIFKEIKKNNAYLIGLIESFLDIYEERDEDVDLKEKLALIRSYNKDMKLFATTDIDIEYQFEIRKAILMSPNQKIPSTKRIPREKKLDLILGDFKITAIKKEYKETNYEFKYKELTIAQETMQYNVNVYFESDNKVKKVLLRTYHDLRESHIQLLFDNKYENFMFGHTLDEKNSTIDKLKSYNINLEKVLIGDSEYLKVLKEKIEFEKLTEDFSILESFVMNEEMFGRIQTNQLYIPELKEAPSFFKKIRQKFGMN